MANKSVTGPQREDRLALQFAIDGDYTTGWLSGRALGADSWHCKTSRSNPLGLAHDKSLVISREKLLRAQRVGRGRTGQGNLAGRPSVPRVEQETRDRPRRRRLLPATAARILGGIAVFQQSENDDHAISDTLTFDFLHRPGPAR